MRLLVSAVLAYLSVVTASPAVAKTEQMKTTWYQCCKKTADGTPFSANNPHIAAHRTLPFGTKLLLRNKGRELCVTVRDRGPFVKGKQLDVTRAAAVHLGFKEAGVVTLNVVENGC